MDKVKIVNALSVIYEKSNTSDDYDGLSKLLDNIKINNLVNYYIHGTDTYDSEDKIIIEFTIKILQNLYNNSGVESPVLDEDYDTLYEIYLNTSNEDIVGGNNTSNKSTAFHKYPDLRGTLDKVHFLTVMEKGKDKRKSVEEWKKSCENRLGRPFNKNEMDIDIYPKFDGLSVIFECDKDGNVINALTRGDTQTNEAILLNHILGAVKMKPYEEWNSEFGVKTEVVMTYKNFEKFCSKYGNFKSPRSAVSSILNSDEFDIKMFKYLTIVPLRMQNFDTKEIIVPGPPIVEYPSYRAHLWDYEKFYPVFNELKEFMKTLLDIPIDGIVIRLSDKNVQTALGRRDDKINNYEVAFKFTPESKKTKLVDVEFCVGVLGTITPVAKVEPVKMEGNTITSPSLGSIDRFESLGLRIGDEVLIKYDIVPYLYVDDTCKHSNNPVIETPKFCPYCKSKLLYDPVLRCVNNDCPSRIIGKITNYTEKMNIENISIGIITTLFKAGYLTKIEDLYSLEKHRANIIEMDGFGKKSFDKIVKSIDKKKEVFDYILMGSIGIPDIGSKIFKNILNIYYIDELKEIAVNTDVKKLTSIHGIKEKTALKIISGIIQNYKLIEFLQKTLIVKHDGRNYKMKVVFTKVRDKEFEKYLDTIEIEVCDSYNKNIDLVICDDTNSTSEKIKKAKKDGKKLMTLKEAKSFFKYK